MVNRGFAFVRYKTEWDVVKAIKLSQGRLIGGRNINIQMAKYDRGNGTNSKSNGSLGLGNLSGMAVVGSRPTPALAGR